jgi:hypothetical protein
MRDRIPFPIGRRFNMSRSPHGFALALLVATTLAGSVPARAADLFVDVDAGAAGLDPAERRIAPERARLVRLDVSGLEALIQSAPDELAAPRGVAGVELVLPDPDRGALRLRVVDSPIVAPELAAKYPEIRTFRLVAPDDPAIGGRADWTPHGFHAVVRTPAGRFYVDPYRPGDVEHYQVYRRSDLTLPAGGFRCDTEAGPVPAPPDEMLEAPLGSGLDLRTYRTAVAATVEYTAFHGGTVPLGLAAIVTAMNRVNEVYEFDVAIRMILIANNDDIIYTAEPDPYTNNNGGTMLGQNQANLDLVIGTANYDIGHVFSTGGGGVAVLNGPCNASSKAQGVTGLSSPTGDPFYIDYVAHEMGHQWGAAHTFNGNAGACAGNRSGTAAFEPGSGSTIMAYAGICSAQNLQPLSDAYFHLISLLHIQTYSRVSGGNACATIVAAGNELPTADAGADYTIPISTPFELFGSGSDPDGSIVSYNWEEWDLGPAGAPTSPSGTAPILRSFDPVPTAWRTFPKLEDLLDGTPTIGELLPTYARNLRFRLTTRDDGVPAGGNDWDEALLTVTDAAGPFLVLSPNTSGTTWNGSGPHAVTWDVAGTDAAPVACATVDILLSTDGGLAFDQELAVNVANDGAQDVFVGTANTSDARVKVKCRSNVFFDVSNQDFSITGATALVFADGFESGDTSRWSDGSL